jgi:pyruvate ferredoxin oxidoreductase gamma subunit
LYRIRFHGRGGQGIKTAGRILGRALFLAGFEVQDAPRYGAERRGAPIFAYVRADRRPIAERGVIRDPDLVVAADDSLVGVPAAGVLAGMGAQTVFLLSSAESADRWRGRLALAGPVLVLPAPAAGEDRAELRYAGAACAGAAARLTGRVSGQALEAAVRTELAGLAPAVLARNIERAAEGYARMAAHEGLVREGAGRAAADWPAPDWVQPVFEPTGLSAPAIHAAATSELQRTGLWRTLRPVVDSERCNRCWWVCSSACPDGAIAPDPGGLPAIDYDHCKGCLVCVAVCPAHAIRAEPEHAAAEAGP